MLSLGISEYQYKMLQKSLGVTRVEDLTDAMSFTAYAYLRPQQLIWRLLEIALRPENQASFKVALQKFQREKERFLVTD